jgi:predicted nucleic acid-binding protein
MYYIDTNIWLNILKKEGELEKTSRQLIDILDSRKIDIFISTVVLKELEFKLKKQELLNFKSHLEILEVTIIKTVVEDYDFARKLEFTNKYMLSFYDFLNIAICKRLNLCLVTRDILLLKTAQNYIKTYNPENLIRKFV